MNKERIKKLESELQTTITVLQEQKDTAEKHGKRRACRRLEKEIEAKKAEIAQLRHEDAEEKKATWQADKAIDKMTKKTIAAKADPVKDAESAKADIKNGSRQVKRNGERKLKKAEKAISKLFTREKALELLLTIPTLPAKLANAVVDTFSADDLKQWVAEYNIYALMAVDGIGEKRAEAIVKTLRKIVYNVRLSTKAEAREKAKGFNVRTFSSDELFRDVKALITELKEYRYRKDESPEIRGMYVEKLEKLYAILTENKPFIVRRNEGRVTRLSRFEIADVFGVDYESKRPSKDFMVLEHEVQSVLDFDWHLFGNEEAEGTAKLIAFQQKVEERIGFYGVRVLERRNETEEEMKKDPLYGGLASSASHQKKEKLLMGHSELLKKHEKFLWFGLTMKEFLQKYKLTGAEYWKMRANEIRPIMKAFLTKDGKVITIRDVLFVKDVKKVYEILNARIFGREGGKIAVDGKAEEPVILGDGAILSLCRLMFQGQGTAAGLKGMVVDGYSALLTACKKHHISIDKLLDMEVEGLDGKMHRIGDYKLVCGEGCWKFDKAFDSITSYVEWLTDMAKTYPGIDNIYLLRQAEEIDGEEKIRKLTRTLIQQWMFMTPAEQRAITNKARASLRKQKTFVGAVSKLAALWKDEEDRLPMEKLFQAAPWLVMNPAIQMWLEEKWYASQTEAMSGKFRTEGQYPYIMQDPVALYEVWLFGMSPDDPTLGLLRGDEVSVADVVDGAKLVCVRFPANFLTAKVMLNRACMEEYESCDGIAIISIYSDILIRQDGDVDGDEMCVLYSKLAVRLTERMLKTFNPPVVLFEHGSKAERQVLGDYATFVHEAYLALWRAKRYDSVGIYANLATACAYLASIDYAIGDTKTMRIHLLWMSAASTGAILAIDQVKGNAVDEKLIKWLDDIRKNVRKDIRKYAAPAIRSELLKTMDDDEADEVLEGVLASIAYPYVHYYVAMAKRDPVKESECAPEDDRNLCDSLAGLVKRDTGVFEFNSQGVVWNKQAAIKALLDWSHPMLNNLTPTTAVRAAVITKESLQMIGDNWANRQQTDENKEFFRRIRAGEPVGQKEALLVFWQNESAMCHHMEGKNLAEKKVEYRKTVKEILYAQADSITWTNKNDKAAAPVGYEFTTEEKHAAVANSAIIDALELQRSNSVDKKGSYAMFVMGVFQDEMLANVKRNGYNAEDFMFSFDMEDLTLDVVLDNLSDEDELYEPTPAPKPVISVDDIPDDYIPDDSYVPEETMWFGGDEEDCGPDDFVE